MAATCFRWFIELTIDDSVWDHSVFSKSRERLDGRTETVTVEFLNEVGASDA